MKVPSWLTTLWTTPPASPPAPEGIQVQDARPESAASPRSQEEEFSADQPIRSKGEDRFNRWPFAQRIAETLAARRDPMCRFF